MLSTNPIWLCFAYVVLVMPFAFRALAVGLNSIDVKTLCEASRSLGASWPRVFFRVLIPNLWQSILSASFISIAAVSYTHLDAYKRQDLGRGQHQPLVAVAAQERGDVLRLSARLRGPA